MCKEQIILKSVTETHNIEYKQELTDGLEKEVVAFLNSNVGGRIILGVNNSGKAIGLNDVDSDALRIKDRLKNISPSIIGIYDLHIVKQSGINLINLMIASGPEKPYYIRKYSMTPKGCFIRLGTAAEPMPQKIIDQHFASRTRSSLVKIKSAKQNLKFAQLLIYYQEKGKPLNENYPSNLELTTENGDYNYNGYLLSDLNTTSFKLAKYSTENRSKLIGVEDYGNTCIITAATKILDRLDIENKTASSINGDRMDKKLWDAEALREAVRNAFVHNDYSTETFPKFEIFSDRLEITTYGGLPTGLSQEEFFSGFSAPRNKVLMRIFRDVGLVENLGFGIPKILESYDRSCFEFSDHFLRMRFHISKSNIIQGGKTGGKTGGKSITQVMGYDSLTPKQRQLLKILIGDDTITYIKIAEAMDIKSTSTVQKHMNGLKKAGAVSRTQDYGGVWTINYKTP